ncbi:hypothetical protein pipiens_010780 [Culex pipiens pipiens]|uniref:Uncharacterized protein n=1 Tax=Culex pipiens pipiens TaxID=38569 RepID=A0ABD1D8U8_CULPP
MGLVFQSWSASRQPNPDGSDNESLATADVVPHWPFGLLPAESAKLPRVPSSSFKCWRLQAQLVQLHVDNKLSELTGVDVLERKHHDSSSLRNDTSLTSFGSMHEFRIASLDRRYKSKNIGLTAKLDQIADLLKKLSAVQCKLSLNAKPGAVTQEVTLLTDEQEELLTAHEALKLKRDSLTEQVEELTESVAVRSGHVARVKVLAGGGVQAG